MKGEDESPADQWSCGREPRADLELEARRLAKLTTTAQARSAEAGKRLRSRLAGYVDASEWMEAEDERRDINGNDLPYPRRLYELADRARELSDDPFRERGKGPRFDYRSRPRDE